MFRTQPYLEKSEYIQINLDTPITLPGNNQAQTKSGYKFTLIDREIFMIGITLISASILSLKLKQTEPTLVLTLNQLRSTVLSH